MTCRQTSLRWGSSAVCAPGDGPPGRDECGCCRCRKGGSFFQRHIPAHHALQVPVLGAQQEGAIFIEGFGQTADGAIPNPDADVASQCRTELLPFLANIAKLAHATASII